MQTFLNNAQKWYPTIADLEKQFCEELRNIKM